MAIEWKLYQRRGAIEARPYVSGEDMNKISVSESDKERPNLDGGMVCRNPDNANDQWYCSADYFAKHYRT